MLNIKLKQTTVTFDPNVQFNFVKEDGMWKLDWDHSVIIPGMQKDQSIHIENLKSERGKILDQTMWNWPIQEQHMR